MSQRTLRGDRDPEYEWWWHAEATKFYR